MDIAPGRWIRLTPDNIAALPNTDGVFEIANLVRNVQFVGRGQGRLRDTLREFGHMPRTLPLSVGGYFFRFEVTTAEGDAFSKRLEAYRKRHEGALPPGNAVASLDRDEALRQAPPRPADDAQQAA